MAILNAVFNELPEFTPATEEGIPVVSKLKLNLILTNQGIKRNNKNLGKIIPEKMPEFPGGPLALRSYIANNVRYPREAMLQKIQGKVFVNFNVDKDGTISNAAVMRGVHFLLDAEAIRVVKNMPNWIPGKKDGKPARVSYAVPINFILQ